MKKSSITDGFKYDLTTILDSGLLFGHPAVLGTSKQAFRRNIIEHSDS